MWQINYTSKITGYELVKCDMSDGQGSRKRTLERKHRRNDQDENGKCGIYDIWKLKMVEEKVWKHNRCWRE